MMGRGMPGALGQEGQPPYMQPQGVPGPGPGGVRTAPPGGSGYVNQQGIGLGGPMHNIGLFPGQRGVTDMGMAHGGMRGLDGPQQGLQFDPASFPVLSGAGPTANRGGYPNGGGGHPMQSDFSIQKEDFPALSAAGGASKDLLVSHGMLGAMQNQPNPADLNRLRELQQDSMVQQQGMAGIGLGMNMGQPLGLLPQQVSSGPIGRGGPGLQQSQQSQQSQQQQQQQQQQQLQQQTITQGMDLGSDSFGGLSGMGVVVPNGPGVGGGLGSSSRQDLTSASKESRYGLAGLLDVIRMTDKDLNTLALGADLTTFGLNLTSADCLYSSFSSPFADAPSSSEPQFTTPPCYLMPPPSLKTEHLTKFAIETLFYMFYSMPRDILQAFAAQELYRRDWRYHGELRLWLKPRTPQELMLGHPNVQFVYWDTTEWQARLFTTAFRGNIAAGLLTEEEIRVKPQGQGTAPLVP